MIVMPAGPMGPVARKRGPIRPGPERLRDDDRAGTPHRRAATGSLCVKTYREGVAAKVGHDLVLEVGTWEATVQNGPGEMAGELQADATSLRVLSGERGVKPLTDRDEIRKNIDDKILRRQPVELHSTAVRASADELAVEGELTVAGSTRPVSARLTLSSDGQLTGTIPVVQSQWGSSPTAG
ncbi:MAG: hypothetical protein QOK21_825 [Solirubrobacteraceae bacterium]|nr:hypothetical protein [Solirubrobacteraceae bacterium]